MPEEKFDKAIDYPICGVLSFVVIAVLSALSRFWLILYFICFSLAVWSAGLALRWLVRHAGGKRDLRFHAAVDPASSTANSMMLTVSQPTGRGIAARTTLDQSCDKAATAQGSLTPNSAHGMD